MASPDPLIGAEIGSCLIESLISRGGMGAVYQGRHRRLDRPVAVKVIWPSQSGGAAAERRFLEEARSAARLEDPRIVRVYDVGAQGPLRYIVMQLVCGATLEDVVRAKGPLPQGEALRVMREVLEALGAAHRQGVVHRDVKPANILIERSGAVKLADFGLAAAGGEGAEIGGAGSFDFMAPEQAFDARPDPRMDLYAFGATYFFALTGTAPFCGAPAEVVIQHRDAPVPDVRERNRHVPPALASLLKRLMEKFPDARPASAAEVLAELSKPGISIEIDASGSPFKILPPPAEAAAAPLVALAPGEALAAGWPDGIPPPPPPVEGAVHAVSWQSKALFAALFAFFFAPSWTRATRGDWLAGALFWLVAGCAAALFMARGRARKAAGTAALFSAAFCLYAGRATYALDFAAGLAAGLGLVLGAAAVYVGFWEEPAERALSCGMLILSFLGLAWASVNSLAALRACAAQWLASGGSTRWVGIMTLIAAYGIVRLSGAKEELTARKERRIVNWNK